MFVGRLMPVVMLFLPAEKADPPAGPQTLTLHLLVPASPPTPPLMPVTMNCPLSWTATCGPFDATQRNKAKSPDARHNLMPDISFVTRISPLYATSVILLACPALAPCFDKRPSSALCPRTLELATLIPESSRVCPSSGVRAVDSCSQDARWVPAPLVRRPGSPLGIPFLN